MTDEQIGEIYSLARESFLGGQQSFQIQAYPFRMTPANLARHRTNPNIAFWKMIKDRQRPFRGDASRAEGRRLRQAITCSMPCRRESAERSSSMPTGRCPAYVVDPEDRRAGAGEAARNDEVQYAATGQGQCAGRAGRIPALDGGMNRVFLAQVGGHIPPARVPPPDMTGLPPQPPPVAVADNNAAEFGEQDFRRRSSAPSNQAPQQRRGRRSPSRLRPARRQSRSRHAERTAVAARQAQARFAQERYRSRNARAAASRRRNQRPAPAPQREANAPAATMGGAQPTMPAGNFDSRWGGLQ